MTSTLLLRLAAPMQAWGAESKFDTRLTQNEPSKSGVIGLLAAALGRKRDASVDDLNKLIFGVRIDQPGVQHRDFHMVHKDAKTSYLTNRYYLEDAVFLVGLESEDRALLQHLEYAVKHPVFPLFLGRKSCPPTLPLVLGVRDKGLIEALSEEESQCSEWMKKRVDASVRIITEPLQGETTSAYRKDLPLSFHPENRKYGYRGVKDRGFVEVGGKLKPDETEHDIMKWLEELSCT